MALSNISYITGKTGALSGKVFDCSVFNALVTAAVAGGKGIISSPGARQISISPPIYEVFVGVATGGGVSATTFELYAALTKEALAGAMSLTLTPISNVFALPAIEADRTSLTNAVYFQASYTPGA